MTASIYTELEQASRLVGTKNERESLGVKTSALSAMGQLTQAHV